MFGSQLSRARGGSTGLLAGIPCANKLVRAICKAASQGSGLKQVSYSTATTNCIVLGGCSCCIHIQAVEQSAFAVQCKYSIISVRMASQDTEICPCCMLPALQVPCETRLSDEWISPVDNRSQPSSASVTFAYTAGQLVPEDVEGH